MIRREPIHPAHCECRQCWPAGPSQHARRSEPLVTWAALIILVLAFWAFPGRPILQAAWRALRPILSL